MINKDYEIKRGDIIVKHWGYSMVLYDFYIVIDVTAKQVKICELKKKTCNVIDCMRFDVVPVDEPAHENPELIRVSKDKLRMQYSLYNSNERYTEDHAD